MRCVPILSLFVATKELEEDTRFTEMVFRFMELFLVSWGVGYGVERAPSQPSHLIGQHNACALICCRYFNV